MTHGSLSTGICGFDIGAEANGIKTLWTSEIDPLRQDVIKYLIPNARHYGDMRRIKNPKKVDIISFGFPCQDISRAKPGGKGIEGEKSGLWYEGWRIIRTCRPKYIIIENSPDLIRKGLDVILPQIAEAGYNAEWDVISCKQFGMPHLRKRLFLLATHSEKERMDQKQIQHRSNNSKYRQKAAQESIKPKRLSFWTGSNRVYSSTFWPEMLTKFHSMDNGLPRGIYNGLVAAAGDTVSPIITKWIFSRIRQKEEMI